MFEGPKHESFDISHSMHRTEVRIKNLWLQDLSIRIPEDPREATELVWVLESEGDMIWGAEYNLTKTEEMQHMQNNIMMDYLHTNKKLF